MKETNIFKELEKETEEKILYKRKFKETKKELTKVKRENADLKKNLDSMKTKTLLLPWFLFI